LRLTIVTLSTRIEESTHPTPGGVQEIAEICRLWTFLARFRPEFPQ